MGTPGGDHRAGHDRDLRDAAISVDYGSDLHHRWVHPARHLRRLDWRPEPKLPVRTLPNRSAGDCGRIYLSSGGDLGRVDLLALQLLERGRHFWSSLMTKAATAQRPAGEEVRVDLPRCTCAGRSP